MDLFAAPGPATHLVRALQGRWSYDDVISLVAQHPARGSMYGKEFDVPRLEGWYGLNRYRYGGQVRSPRVWPDVLHAICSATEDRLALSGLTEDAVVMFDSCFVNSYRDGHDTIDWHADDDPWIGPWIASVSFGGVRIFKMKETLTGRTVSYELGDGDILVMPPGTQESWMHTIPRTKRDVSPRVNLTFRQTIGQQPLARGRDGRGVAA